jgi:xanthine dehydrogenase small subunit
MVKLHSSIRFILNEKEVCANVPPGLLALDYVREQQQLTGTKSGCKEGDCGACTVLVGDLDPSGELRYQPMTSCLLPMGELRGKHLVTIEGLNMEQLSPVQHAMVECGGTQCGYCTPGFVVSMTAGLMEPKLPLNKEGVRYAISGNLCRCTGYRSILSAGQQVVESLAGKFDDSERIAALVKEGALPVYFSEIADRLRALRDSLKEESGLEDWSTESDASDNHSRLIVTGGTDLYVQRGEEIPDADVELLNNRPPVPPAELRRAHLFCDARMTFEDFADDPLVRRYLPDMPDYNLLIASWPMRTRSSIGGNICNASPIADMTCLLLALETELVLLGNGGRRRTLPLREFYLGYKKLNKAEEEIVEAFSFPVFDNATRVNWEKVSKRAWLDIATVNAACKVRVREERVTDAHFALGGVAATPLYLQEASRFLEGQPLTERTVRECVAVAMNEFAPISDVRGSAHYKRLLARQLMLAHFGRLFPEAMDEKDLYATF